MKSWHNEGKSIVEERFIRILKTKIQEYIGSLKNNVYTDKLDDIVNECNNTDHSTIKMKPANVYRVCFRKKLHFTSLIITKKNISDISKVNSLVPIL